MHGSVKRRHKEMVRRTNKQVNWFTTSHFEMDFCIGCLSHEAAREKNSLQRKGTRRHLQTFSILENGTIEKKKLRKSPGKTRRDLRDDATSGVRETQRLPGEQEVTRTARTEQEKHALYFMCCSIFFS